MGCGFSDSCADCSLGGVFDCDGCDPSPRVRYDDWDTFDSDDDYESHEEDSCTDAIADEKRFCVNCGAQTQLDWKYCLFCGVKLSAKHCTNCGKPVDEQWSYCPFCSSALSQSNECEDEENDSSYIDGSVYDEEIPF